MNIKPSSTLPKGGISKREFLRLSAAGLGGLLLSTRGLSGLVLGLGSSSCGPSLQDVRNVNKGIEDIVYECNPILPIPKRGCYTGTNEQSGVNMKSVASLGLRFKDTYGLPPALNAPGVGTWGCANDDFPKECEAFLSAGIIPMLRYVVSPYNFIRGGFKEIANGASDEYFKRFAAKAAEFGKAIVLVPWQCVNEPYWERQVWRWSRADPSEYKAAWVRMHDIFEQEGANKNVVWSTKLVAWGFDQSTPARDPFDYIPDKEHVDILGWLCNANFPGGAPSFNSMFRSTYIEASTKYSTKPQIFWELGTHNEGGDQAGWFDSALSSIAEQYPRVKGVMFDVMYSPISGFNPTHSKATINVIRKHFASGYYKGKALP